jgi:hypothetical protein
MTIQNYIITANLIREPDQYEVFVQLKDTPNTKFVFLKRVRGPQAPPENFIFNLFLNNFREWAIEVEIVNEVLKAP